MLLYIRYAREKEYSSGPYCFFSWARIEETEKERVYSLKFISGFYALKVQLLIINVSITKIKVLVTLEQTKTHTKMN